MKFFSLIDRTKSLHPAPKTRIVPQEAFSALLSADEMLGEVQKDALEYRNKVAKECEEIKEAASKEGFEAGQLKWTELLQGLEEERTRARKELEDSLVPLALAAVKKIVGRELELKPETVVDIVATALKAVTTHKKVTIYVNRGDLEWVEREKPRFKALFENLQILSIAPREDVQPGGCVIETEVGIINAQLPHQLDALEGAFRSFFEAKREAR